MQLFVNFSVLIIFVVWQFYEIQKNNRLSKKGTEEFWKKEQLANLSRRADISGLDYITIPLKQLPMADTDDPTINSYRDTINKLADKKILNLAGFTNTDLKMKYGASNINILSEYDNNYLILVSILHKWGERLYRKGYTEAALSVLEYAVMCLTDVRMTYQLLAEIYRNQHKFDKIDALIDKISSTNIIRKDKLTEELNRIKNT